MKRFGKARLALVATGVFCLIGFCLRAQDAAATAQSATVVALRGAVEIIDTDGASRQAQLQGEMMIGDTVKTGDRGRVQISFPDGSLISLGRNTEMTLDAFEFDSARQDGHLETTIKEGVFRVMGGAITRVAPENFKTRTPTATIGIRGSFYTGTLFGSKLTVVFLGGRGIVVSNSAGRVSITTPNYGTVVDSAQSKPQRPRRFAVAELDAFMNSFMERGEGEPDEGGAEDGGGLPPDESGLDGAGPVPDEKPPESETGESSRVAQTLSTQQQQNQLAPDDAGTPDVPDVPPVPPAPGTTLALTGQYVAAREGYAYATRYASAGEVYRGTVSAENANGALAGAAHLDDGVTFPFAFSAPAPQPGGIYAGTVGGSGERTLTLAGEPWLVPFSATADNLGEFMVFGGTGTSASVGEREAGAFAELGYAGAVVWALPSDGLAVYEGPGLVAVTDAVGGGVSTVAGASSAAVNFQNGKIAGWFESASGEPLFFYGDVAAGGDMRVVGSGVGLTAAMGGWPATVSGFGDTAAFYGSDGQGFGFTARGILDAVADGSAMGEFDIIGGMFKTEELALAPTGSATWHGFAVGIGESVFEPGLAPRVFDNATSDDFTLALDRTAGTVDGVLRVSDPSTELALSPLLVGGEGHGGSQRSAYVHDRHFLAELGGSGVGVGRSTAESGSGVLVTASSAAEPLSEWLTWGYWAVSYHDPDASSYAAAGHVSMPGAVWVAGERTPRAAIQALIDTPSASGTYEGGARGIESHPELGQLPMVGTARFNVFFHSRVIAGTMTFPELSMHANATIAATGAGFQGAISAVDRGGVVQTPAASRVQGDFYGPQAEALGGSFSARMGTGDSTYIGVFGADRN